MVCKAEVVSHTFVQTFYFVQIRFVQILRKAALRANESRPEVSGDRTRVYMSSGLDVLRLRCGANTDRVVLEVVARSPTKPGSSFSNSEKRGLLGTSSSLHG